MRYNLQMFSHSFIFNFNLIFSIFFFQIFNSFGQKTLPEVQNQRFIPNEKEVTLKILHLGDSHLQPNNLSGMTRFILQQKIGNAGRGLIFPYNLARTNGPKDFSFSSDISWTSAWITNPSNQSIGLTGISIKSSVTSGSVSWSTGKDSLDYPHQKGILRFEMEDCRECSIEIEGVSKNYSGQDKIVDTLSFFVAKDSSTIKFRGGYFTLLDLLEETSFPGLIYNSTGVAGATFDTYNKNSHFGKGLALINPDLIIISLGTNESFKKWDSTAFSKSVNLHLDTISENCPEAEVILVLPNENYRKSNGKFVYNSQIDSVRMNLKKIAEDRNLITYDQQEAMGGKGCVLEWKKNGLVNDDHIHFLRKGYQKQGELLAEFLWSYLSQNSFN